MGNPAAPGRYAREAIAKAQLVPFYTPAPNFSIDVAIMAQAERHPTVPVNSTWIDHPLSFQCFSDLRVGPQLAIFSIIIYSELGDKVHKVVPCKLALFSR